MQKKSILKLLIAAIVAIVSIGLPLYASGLTGVAPSQEIRSADAYFPDAEEVTLFNKENSTGIALARNAENPNVYEGTIVGSSFPEWSKLNVKIGSTTFGVGNVKYCDKYNGNVPLPTTPIEFSTANTDWNNYIEIGKFPYDDAKFTVEVTSETTLNLTITPIIPEAPVVGSTITVKNLLYDQENNVVDTWTLENSAENPYVFKGSITTVRQYSAITFTYNDVKYAFTRTEYDELPAEVELFKGQTGNVYYKGSGISQKINIEVTLSELQNSMKVKFMLATPVSVVVNDVEHQLCEDIYAVTSDKIEYASPIQVEEGGSTKIAVKIGNKTYGLAAPVSFDETNNGEQVVTADLTTEGGSAAELNLKGIYTVAVLLNADGYKLSITKAAAGNEMTFGKGSPLIFNEETSQWEGAVEMTANQVLPALTYLVYDAATNTFTTRTYWFPCDIDDPDGVEQTVKLTTKDQSDKNWKCVTPGSYKLTVTIAEDGTATAKYINIAPPVKIEDLYVCVYNGHYENGYDGKFGYYNDGEFSTDYKVTYRLADGSYAIALLMDTGQAFYIMNNGIAYRPKAEDMNKAFGDSEGKMETFTFSPSDDHSLRKHVSNDYIGYRMLIIKPNGSNIDVKGYQIKVGDDTRMKIIESLASPVDAFGHMADLIIKFKDDKNQGYLNGYRKMQLNPSGTYGLYNVELKAGQEFEVYRGRAIYDDGGNVIGIEDKDKVQYGCKNSPAEGATSVTMVDGDYTSLQGPNGTRTTMTYSVTYTGEYSFVIFYNVPEQTKTLWVSRKVPKDRGIKVGVYDSKGERQGDLVDMQYKNTNRRNLMTVLVPKGGYVKFGVRGDDGKLKAFDFYNLGLSNEVGYDTPAKGEKTDRFYARDEDYVTRADKCWYRFRIRLREDNNYYLSYQVIPMPEKTWLYVTNGNETKEYESVPEMDEQGEYTGHYIFNNVDLLLGDQYYFVNRKGGEINTDWTLKDGDPADGLIWYSAHDSSMNLGTDGNPVKPGRWINMFSHLNVGTDYQDSAYKFKKFTYYDAGSSSETRALVDLHGIKIDMDITTMSHRFSVDYDGLDYYFEGSCAGIQLDGRYHPAKKEERYHFVYHPTTGYYTCYLDYLWGDWFIYNYDSKGAQQTPYYPYNLNNVVHELNQPYYLSDGANRFISDFKKETASGTAADVQVNAGASGGTFKDNCMIAMAPGATSIIWGAGAFQGQGIAQTPVYKDVTVVFDPANNVLWLVSGRPEGDAGEDDPYGELYLVFTDVEPEEWATSRVTEDSAERGAHWVKLTPDPNEVGRFYANGVNFPARADASHSAYFFSNRLGKTLAETIRYSNSYHAGETDPTFEDTSDETLYGSVFTKLVYNEAGKDGEGSFESHDKPMSLISTSATAYATTVYVRRWDKKENAPFEDCVIESEENAPAETVRRLVSRAEENQEGADNGAEITPDGTIYVTTTDEQPTDLKEKDYVVRTFASEPYVYDVTVHLGRQMFDLVTTPRDLQQSGIEDLTTDAPSTAVIRAASGHISVTGAKTVSVYTISGRSLLLNAPEADLDVAPGIYIIVADGHASKHIL